MSGVKWDIPRFRELCRLTNITYPRLYTISLLRKKELVDYHANLTTKVWKDLFKQHKTISFNSQEWINAEIVSEANAIAMAQSLHSMADIMSQVVYRIILNSGLNEQNITFYKVKKKLEERSSTDISLLPIKDAMEDLWRNNSFQYIASFVNTVKHRSIVDTKYTFELKQGRYRQGIKFKKFNYKGTHYPEVWTDELVKNYKEEVLELIIKIGCTLNNYLERIFLKIGDTLFLKILLGFLTCYIRAPELCQLS
ncbi:MAG TPA: hypothetical protein ENI33_09410 [Thermoplasmatales archaeon]|nr:hypothetical protein [Thermoplasmatales archaeon]